MPDQITIAPILKSRTLGQVALMALIVGAYSGLAIWKEYSDYRHVGDVPAELHSALSLVLGLLLVFRTQAAFARWWEARTLWGSLVNASRNLAAKLTSLVIIPREQLEDAVRMIIGFAYCLRDHLRDERPRDLPPDLGQAVEGVQHVPAYLVNRLYGYLSQWKAESCIDGDELRVLDRELSRLLDICGGCERIKRTRIVRSYRLFARQCILLFLLTLPWGIVNAFQWWTIPLTVITAYFMLGLEVVAEHVEEPFGYDEDDLDLDGICRAIDASVHELVDASVNDNVARLSEYPTSGKLGG